MRIEVASLLNLWNAPSKSLQCRLASLQSGLSHHQSFLLAHHVKICSEEKKSKCERKESLDSKISEITNSTLLGKVRDSFHPSHEFHLLTNVPLGSLTTSRTLSTTPTWEEIQLVRLDGEVFHLQERKNSGKGKPDSLDGDHGEERAEAFKEGGLPA